MLSAISTGRFATRLHHLTVYGHRNTQPHNKKHVRCWFARGRRSAPRSHSSVPRKQASLNPSPLPIDRFIPRGWASVSVLWYMLTLGQENETKGRGSIDQLSSVFVYEGGASTCCCPTISSGFPRPSTRAPRSDELLAIPFCSCASGWRTSPPTQTRPAVEIVILPGNEQHKCGAVRQ